MSAVSGPVRALVAEMGRRDAQRIVRDLTIVGKQPVMLLTKVLTALELGRHAGGQYGHHSHAVQCPWVACCGAACQVWCVCSSGCMSSCQLTEHPGCPMLHGTLQAAQASTCTALQCLCVAVLSTVTHRLQACSFTYALSIPPSLSQSLSPLAFPLPALSKWLCWMPEHPLRVLQEGSMP